MALRTAGPAGRPAPEILYGRRKMTAWPNRAMAAEGRPPVSKHTVHRLMAELGMNGLIRGRKTRTTVPGGKDARRAGDLLNRQFSAPRPNHASVTDFTYDHFNRAVLQGPVESGQYTAIRFTDTLALEGLVASIGSVGDAYDNAAAETVMGVFKNEAVAAGSPFRDGPLRQLADVERLTTDYVHWYNHDRLHGELGHIPPEEYEHAYYAAPPDPPPGESSHRKTA